MKTSRAAIHLGLAAVLLSSASAAVTVHSENVTADLQNETVNVEMSVSDFAGDEFTYTTSYTVDEVIGSQVGALEDACTARQLDEGSEVACPVVAENFSANMELGTDGLVGRSGSKSVFNYSKSFVRITERFQLDVVLPRGEGLVPSNSSFSPVRPEDGKRRSVDGRRFKVVWSQQPGFGEEKRFSAVYEPLSEGPDRTLWIVTGAALATLVILGAYLYYRLHRGSRAKDEFETLTEDQQEVVRMISTRDGSMLQKDVVDETEYSKAKVSNIVGGLEEKGAVTKKKQGRSNMLELNRNLRALEIE
nr:MAG: hypothetical protein J07AB56_14050 [Candidatus Nanosalinarum sp. J07AB56]